MRGDCGGQRDVTYWDSAFVVPDLCFFDGYSEALLIVHNESFESRSNFQ